MVRKFNFKCIVCFIVLFAVVIPHNLGAQSRGEAEQAKELLDLLFKKKNKTKKVRKEEVEKSTKKRNAKEENTEASTEKKSEPIASDDVALVVFGEGTTKDEATKAALRSAIEQSFGTFVSTDTKILNDDLVKDEIVTISSGNVKSYEYVSEENKDNKVYVTLKAVVSIGKLVEYSKSKGSSAELAGAAFAMDMKLKRFYMENEEKAKEHLRDKLLKIMSEMFDYKIQVNEPKMKSDNTIRVVLEIGIYLNDNFKLFCQEFWNTVKALSITEEEAQNVSGIYNVSHFYYYKYPEDRIALTGYPNYYLRTSWQQFLDKMDREFLDATMNFQISDGIDTYKFEGGSRANLMKSESRMEFYSTTDETWLEYYSLQIERGIGKRMKGVAPSEYGILINEVVVPETHLFLETGNAIYLKYNLDEIEKVTEITISRRRDVEE